MFESESAIFLGQVGHCALEPGVVVGGNLVGDVVVPRVVVIVVRVRAADEGAEQGLRVGRRVPLLRIPAASGSVGAGTGPGGRLNRIFSD